MNRKSGIAKTFRPIPAGIGNAGRPSVFSARLAAGGRKGKTGRLSHADPIIACRFREPNHEGLPKPLSGLLSFTSLPGDSGIRPSTGEAGPEARRRSIKGEEHEPA